MKRLVKNETLCVGCHTCEWVCAKAYYKTEDPGQSCIRIDDMPDGTSKIRVCTQCGKCAEVCNTGVISLSAKGVYMINKKECAGCLMCVGFCPEDVIAHSDVREEPSKCTACGMCATACPTGALQLVDDFSWLD